MNQQRRLVLGGAALALLSTPSGQAAGAPIVASTRGKPGDFDFLEGTWKIHNRRWKPTGEVDVFEGESTCHTILGGAGSVEDLRLPARNFAGLGLRLLDRDAQVWVDHWVNAAQGVLTLPGTQGGFIDGVGTFTGDHKDGERTMTVRGVWDEITGSSCRWTQTVSYDGGKTWMQNWSMAWTRVSR
jgi:hypothetical protein